MLSHSVETAGTVANIDGRVLRGVRTRQAIISAMRELFATAEHEPTLRAIARQAGVSQRIVLRYYGDVGRLVGALVVDDVRNELVARYSTMRRAPSLDDRIASFVDLRVELCEKFAPAWLRAVQMTRHTPEMNRLVDRGYADLRDLAGNMFADELRGMSYAFRQDLLDQLTMLVDAYHWRYLRHTCGRAPDQVKVIWQGAIRRVVAS